MLNVGVHVSIAGSIDKAVDRALSLKCTTMQIFARNPRKFRRHKLKSEAIELFTEKLKHSGISPLVIHTPYTLNLATPQKFLYWITGKEFISDLMEADKLDAQYLVTHTGCYKGTTEAKGLKRVAKILKKILKNTEGISTKILLENTAGSGTWLGADFAHYRYILEELKWTERIGICLDTAHAWSAGYEINVAQGVEELLQDIDTQVGVERIKVIHLNDTQELLGSRKDRHAHIGKGKIGNAGVALLLNHPWLREIPFILETPKESKEDDRKNIEKVRRLYRNGV